MLHGGLPREWKELFRVDNAVASYVLNTFECADRCVHSDISITFQMHTFDSFKYARDLRGFILSQKLDAVVGQISRMEIQETRFISRVGAILSAPIRRARIQEQRNNLTFEDHHQSGSNVPLLSLHRIQELRVVLRLA